MLLCRLSVPTVGRWFPEEGPESRETGAGPGLILLQFCTTREPDKAKRFLESKE